MNLEGDYTSYLEAKKVLTMVEFQGIYFNYLHSFTVWIKLFL